MNTIIKFAGILVATLILIMLFALLSGVPVYFLWNWLCPKIFNLPVITFWQAVGLSALCGCLFKNTSASSSSKS